MKLTIFNSLYLKPDDLKHSITLKEVNKWQKDTLLYSCFY